MFTKRLVLLSVFVLTCGSTFAAPNWVFDQATFDGVVGAFPRSDVDFDSVAPGPIADGGMVDGLMFTYVSGLEPNELNVVADSSLATTGSNYLGSDVNGLLGDDLSFSISSTEAFFALSFQVVAPDFGLFADDIRITVNGLTTNFAPDFAPADGVPDNEVQVGNNFRYFFGVTDPAGFDSVTISTPQILGASEFFGIDSIQFVSASAVPEPGSLALLTTLGVNGAWRLGRRKSKKPATP